MASKDPDLNSAETLAKYKEILVSNQILDPVAEIHVEDPNLRGQGRGSDRRCVTIKFENPELPELHFFTKVVVASNASYMEGVRGIKAFEKEAVLLTKYVPAAKEYLKQKGLDEKFYTDIYPKCYYGDENMIVLENLVYQGYKIMGMKEDDRHDWEIAKIVLESIAKHQALSYAMIMDGGGPEKFFERFDPLGHDGLSERKWASTMEPWIQSAFKTNKKVLELSRDIDGAPEALEILKKLEKKKESLSELWRSSIVKEGDEFLLLDHGDPWFTNMMFLKDIVTGEIISHKLLDFQILRYNSPAFDLGYYFFTSLRTDLRQNRLHELLQYYLFTLRKLSTELGHPIGEEQLSFETLLLQFRKRIYYGLINSFTTQYGGGPRITKDVDLAKIDSKDWDSAMNKLTEDWITKNSEEARQVTTELISVLKEVDKLAV